jgi:hypothetical protein
VAGMGMMKFCSAHCPLPSAHCPSIPLPLQCFKLLWGLLIFQSNSAAISALDIFPGPPYRVCLVLSQ